MAYKISKVNNINLCGDKIDWSKPDANICNLSGLFGFVTELIISRKYAHLKQFSFPTDRVRCRSKDSGHHSAATQFKSRSIYQRP